jgi:hypothetical protein
MSRKLNYATVPAGTLDALACDIGNFCKKRGVTPSMTMNAALFLYAKFVVENDIDEEQSIESLRRLLKTLRIVRPS